MNSEISEAEDLISALPLLTRQYSITESSFERPVKFLKTTHHVKQENSASPPPPPPPPPPCASHILTFDKSCPDNYEALGSYDENLIFSSKGMIKGTDSMARSPSFAQEHILAERRRREKVNQRFIALTSIIPGLKKKDKASVLGEAITYVKQLQGHVKVLEEQNARRNVESVVLVRKSELSSCADDGDSGRQFEALFPEIEARVSENDVLIRIHFEKDTSLVVKVLSGIKKLHLSVVSSNVLPFGSSTLDMTVLATKDSEFNMPVKNLVRELRRLIC